MYSTLKTIFNTVFSKKMRYRLEPILRSSYSIFKKGKNHLCVICNFESSGFERLQNNDLLCPKCGSLARDRRLWQILNEQYIKPNINVLDFSPSRTLYRNWKKQINIKYISSDLSDNFIADVAYDITNIPGEKDQFDLIVCYHILEHVIDDVNAISELHRVLKPNGTIILQTPFKEGALYEDYSITSEADRLIHFGQIDHVRFYNVDGLKNRLEDAGLKVQVTRNEKNDYLGFSDSEIILFATK